MVICNKWYLHTTRPGCKHVQKMQKYVQALDKTAKATSYPGIPLQQRIILLHTFNSTYQWSIQRALISAILHHAGQLPLFEYDKYLLWINLKHREGCDGDPSRAFRIESAAFRPLDDIQGNTRQSWDSGQARREERERVYRATNKNFLGLLKVAFSMEDYIIFEAPPVTRELSDDLRSRRPPIRHDMWLTKLSQTVELGLVYNPTEGKAGRYKKQGTKWHWIPLSQGELAAEDIPLTFFPGLHL
jgi:hypothetical protein